MMETTIWWTGASVLFAGAALAAMGAFSALVIAATFLANYYLGRAGNVAENLYLMREWRAAGCPRWYFEAGKMTQMKPATVKPAGDVA